MENNIIYKILNSNLSLEKQIEYVKTIRTINSELSDDTKKIISIIENTNDKNRVANELSLNTYTTFNKVDLDLDLYFWEVNNKLDLDEMLDNFISEKEKEINAKRIQDAYQMYEETGDIIYLKEIQFLERQTSEDFINISEAVDRGIEYLRKIKDKENVSRVKFSPSFFNTQLNTKGFDEGEFILLAARPGVGKTAIGLAYANDFSKQGKRVLFISLEMTVERILERMLIAKTGVTSHTIESNAKFTDEIFERFKTAGEELKQQPIDFLDKPSVNFLELKDQIVKKHRERPYDIIILDYLSLIQSYDGKSNNDIRVTTTFVSRGLKLLAMELRIPIIALQQTSRQGAVTRSSSKKLGEDIVLDSSYGELQLTDLRESGSLEQDANKVFLVWRETPKDEEEYKTLLDYGKANLIFSIAKNREGQAGHLLKYEFNMNLQRIREVAWLTKPSHFTGGDDK